MLDERQPIIGFSCFSFSFIFLCNFRVFREFYLKKVGETADPRRSTILVRESAQRRWGSASSGPKKKKKKKLLICFCYLFVLFCFGSYTHEEKTNKAIKEYINIFMKKFQGSNSNPFFSLFLVLFALRTMLSLSVGG